MAEILLKYYKLIGDQMGFTGQMKLAQKTLIPSIKAASTPDSKENIDLFRKAIEEITGHPAPKL